jgi:ubiquinone/menaquinone biosynthesis C-methylase UbiE
LALSAIHGGSSRPASAHELELTGRCSYVEGVAEALPFGDQSFDLVSRQTLLIHRADPAAVMGEMRRVARPGGLQALEANRPYAAGGWVESVEVV